MDEAFRFERNHVKEDDPDDRRFRPQRDRDRILYTSAFRRLAQVTQVVSANEGRVFHNRLTHSLQVGQVGRRIAERLLRDYPTADSDLNGLDPEVVEAACLAHDLGHPPFGHIAEDKLKSLAGVECGGFEGNAQSFRIVTKLAFRSFIHPGLDLTRATLAAILKYPWKHGENSEKPKKWGAYLSEKKDFDFAMKLVKALDLPRSPEADLMDWADDVTYSVHDVEDFYRIGRIPMHLLSRYTDNPERKAFFDDVFRRRKDADGIWSKCSRSDLEQVFTDLLLMYFKIKEPFSGTRDQRSGLRDFTAKLIRRYVNAVEIEKPSGTPAKLRIDDDYEKEVAMLKELTWTYVIEAPSLANQQEGQRTVIEGLFNFYNMAAGSQKEWRVFPAFYRQQLDEDCKTDLDRRRVVIDMIAGMTEPQAVELYQQIKGIALGSGLKDILM